MPNCLYYAVGSLSKLVRYLEDEWGSEIEEILKHIKKKDPIELLIRTVLSQNTSDRNADRAFENLKKLIKGDFKELLNINLNVLKEAIKPAGMQNQRAKRIVELIKVIYEKYNGDLSWIRRLPMKEARSELLKLPGVGYKTADIMLVFYGEKDVLPIDTHITRIANRIGYVKTKRYEEIRRRLEQEIEQGKKAKAHLLLIMFGRRICKAKRPLCDKCPINKECPYALKRVRT